MNRVHLFLGQARARRSPSVADSASRMRTVDHVRKSTFECPNGFALGVAVISSAFEGPPRVPPQAAGRRLAGLGGRAESFSDGIGR